ncbi:urease-associated protein [Novosphingobium endophyticum]|uniref:Urease-associated protein n=1 Tax=Novosphingobium endophyticum TaxID=1955250 RepID=A0A916TWS6_9SPHN|nr:TIGR02117 family protein [Novosphingobium endophyticum]GGC09154.1 urease-associated protein [Novosphingobium endophyticum]
MAAILCLVLAYLAAALAGSLLPANGDWEEPDHGVRIFVYTGAVHTGVLVPAMNGIQDWRHLVKAEHFVDPRYAASSHLLFGWGERDFYLDTPTWAETDPLTVLKALFYGRRTLLHVDYIHSPKPGPNLRPLVISEEQYRQLSRQIESQFQLDRNGRPQPIEGYGPADVFYESTGHYNFVRTCNEWTGEQLRKIGVEIGQWTPFSQSVMIWFSERGAGREAQLSN